MWFGGRDTVSNIQRFLLGAPAAPVAFYKNKSRPWGGQRLVALLLPVGSQEYGPAREIPVLAPGRGRQLWVLKIFAFVKVFITIFNTQSLGRFCGQFPGFVFLNLFCAMKVQRVTWIVSVKTAWIYWQSWIGSITSLVFGVILDSQPSCCPASFLPSGIQ